MDDEIKCDQGEFIHAIRVKNYTPVYTTCNDNGINWIEITCSNPFSTKTNTVFSTIDRVDLESAACTSESLFSIYNNDGVISDLVDEYPKYMCPCAAYYGGTHHNAGSINPDDFGLGGLAVCFCDLSC